MLSAPPDVIRWSPRSDSYHGDCAVAAIEIAYGVTYETALSCCLGVCSNVLANGMTIREMKKAIGFLGYHTRVKWTKIDLADETGILGVDTPTGKHSHVVYLWEGRIIEPMCERRQLWLNAEDFIAHYGYRVDGLIIAGEPIR